MNMLWQEWAYRLGWTMLHSLWEGAGVVLLLAVALCATRRRSPNVRYAISTIAMGALVGVIGYTFARIVPVSAAKEAAIAAHAMASVDRSVTPVQSNVESPAPREVFKMVPAPEIQPVMVRWREWRAWLQPALPWLAGIWAAGVCLLSLSNAGSWLAVQRLRVLGVSAIDARWAEVAERLALRLGIRRRVRVARSSRVETPIVVGWWRPLILVPASVLVGLAPAQLEAILAHELAHVRRHDYLVNLMQVMVETLLFYHPVVWWISSRMRLEREHCCDDVAVAVCGDRRSYAESLAALEEVRLGANFQLAAGGSGGAQLIKRVRRILGISPAGSGNPAWRGAAVVAMIAVAVTIAACTHVRSVKEPAVAAIDLQELVRRLEQAESAIHNLRVEEFEMTESFQLAGAKDWQETPFRWAGSAWYGEPKAGKFRMNFTQEVLAWEPFKGDRKPGDPVPAGYCEQSYEIAFDGEKGRELYLKSGMLGQSVAQVYANVYPGERPGMDQRFHHYATGAGFSLSYLTEQTGNPASKPLSVSFKEGLDRGTRPAITATLLDGQDAIKISFGVSGNGTSFWFDPHRGYSLMARESIHDGAIQQRVRITQLAEAAPGIWFPVSGYRDEPAVNPSEPKGLHRYRFTVKKAVANDPAFDQGIFTIALLAPIQTRVVRPATVETPSLPAAGSEEIRAKRAKSANNLLQIGNVLALYTNESNGVFPPDLATAIKEEEMPPSLLRSPLGDEKVGYDYTYRHFAGMKRPVRDNLVIAYDTPDAARNGGASVLFGNGQVKWLDAGALTAALKIGDSSTRPTTAPATSHSMLAPPVPAKTGHYLDAPEKDADADPVEVPFTQARAQAATVHADLKRLEALQAARQDDAAIEKAREKAQYYDLQVLKAKKQLLLITDGNYFLEKAAAVMDADYHTTVMTSAQYTTTRARRVDVVWFDRFSPKEPCPVSALYFDAVPPGSSLTVDKHGKPAKINEVTVTDWDTKHPVLNGVSLGKLYAQESLMLKESENWQTIARSGDHAMIVADKMNARTVIVGFDVLQSNWPLRVSFPTFTQRATDWLIAVDAPVAPAATQPHTPTTRP